jgi:hypothetical protein
VRPVSQGSGFFISEDGLSGDQQSRHRKWRDIHGDHG